MENQKETIRKFVGYLNNPEKDGLPTYIVY